MQWVRAVVFFAGAMACASIHRVTFSVLAIPIREEFALSLPQMGILQSAVLAGYIIGQVGRGSPPLHMLCSPCFLTTTWCCTPRQGGIRAGYTFLA